MYFSEVVRFFLCFILAMSNFSRGTRTGFFVSIMPDLTGAGQLVYFPVRPEDMIFSSMSILPEYFYVSNITNIVSLAADPSDDKLYAFDLFSHKLYELGNVNSFANGTITNVDVLHEGISETTSQVAFDWLSKNIYWTDQVFNWIVMQSVSSKDRTMYKIIVHERLNAPIAIAVDPVNGFLFWSELGNTSYIERSSLTGQGTEMIFTGLTLVTDMVADPDDKRLYWLDVGRTTLESGRYNGTDRRVIRRSTSFYTYMTGLTLYRNLICFTVQSSFMIECLVKHTGDVIWSHVLVTKDVGRVDFKMPWAIQSYDPGSYNSVTHPCESFGCEHLCVIIHASPVCLCKEGYQLEADEKNCTRKHNLYVPGILIVNGSSICMLDVRIITGQTNEPICIIQWYSDISFVAVDSNNNVMYFCDEENREIVMYDFVLNVTTTIVSTSNVSDMIFDWIENISGMAYDWINKDIYWSEEDTGLIKLVKKSQIVKQEGLIFQNLNRPSKITINPHNMTLFWVAGGNAGSKIEAGSFDGTEKWTVVDAVHIRNPSDLYFDCIQDRLYWIDDGVVYSTDPGSGYVQFHFPTGKRTKLLKYKGYILTTDEEGSIATAVSTASAVSNVIDFPSFSSVRDMAIFDTEQQFLERGPCDNNNGGCEQICIPRKRSAVCRCGLGYSLLDDQKHCSSGSAMEQNFALVSDLTHGIIYQISLDSRGIAAVDIPIPISPTHAIFDSPNKYIYWSDTGMKQIRRVNSDGTNMVTLLNTGSFEPHGIEIDPSTGNLFYSAVGPTSYIGVIDPRTTQRKVIVKGLSSVHSIALFPKRGLLFWTDSDLRAPYLGRSAMDGRDVVKLVTKSIISPNGLTIDFTSERIYWTDGELHTIRSCDIEGYNIVIHLVDMNASPAQVALSGPYIYYTSINKQIITKVNKIDGSTVPWMADVPELGRLESLVIYPGNDVPVHSGCSQSNGLCSTFCFPMPIGRVCACDEGITLMSDKRTCSGVLRCDEPIPNGKLDSACSGYEGAVCTFVCEDGYQKIENKSNVQCTNDGKWNESVVNLCLQPPKPKDSEESSINTSAVAGGIFASIIAAVVALSLIIVLLCRRDIIPVFKANRTPSIRFVQEPPVLNDSVRKANQTKTPVPCKDDGDSVSITLDPPSQIA